VSTVPHSCANFSLYGTVEPPPGERCCLELPHRNTQMFQSWVDGFAGACAASCHLVVLDHGALHQAKAVQWPAHVVPVFLPPSRPELTPIARLWRALKEKWAAGMAKTLAE
jgi:DDE superfamily endonuclease